MRVVYFDFHEILLKEKSNGNISTYNHAKLLWVQDHCVRFDKIDGYIQIYDGTIYLVLFGI